MDLYLVKFEVRGMTRFPLEMLSYDACFPLGSENADLIAEALRPNRRPRTIVLGKYSFEPGKVARLRWRSFGWNVARVESRMADVQKEPAESYCGEPQDPAGDSRD